jgi:hypothetical protein
MTDDRSDAHTLTSVEQLEALYGQPVSRSLSKEIDYISDHYRSFIEAAPFVVVATIGPDGIDCSPRGDPPGFVRVVDPHTVLIPDRRGNNRLDSLRNIVQDPLISLLFLIPGVGEAMRINGRAEITTDPQLCASFAMQGKVPQSIIRVKVDRIYFQCQKALTRSRLWQQDAKIDRTLLPTAGEMSQALSADKDFDGAAYDRDYPERMKKTLY